MGDSGDFSEQKWRNHCIVNVNGVISYLSVKVIQQPFLIKILRCLVQKCVCDINVYCVYIGSVEEIKVIAYMEILKIR